MKLAQILSVILQMGAEAYYHLHNCYLLAMTDSSGLRKKPEDILIATISTRSSNLLEESSCYNLLLGVPYTSSNTNSPYRLGPSSRLPEHLGIHYPPCVMSSQLSKPVPFPCQLTAPSSPLSEDNNSVPLTSRSFLDREASVLSGTPEGIYELSQYASTTFSDSSGTLEGTDELSQDMCTPSSGTSLLGNLEEMDEFPQGGSATYPRTPLVCQSISMS